MRRCWKNKGLKGRHNNCELNRFERSYWCVSPSGFASFFGYIRWFHHRQRICQPFGLKNQTIRKAVASELKSHQNRSRIKTEIASEQDFQTAICAKAGSACRTFVARFMRQVEMLVGRASTAVCTKAEPWNEKLGYKLFLLIAGWA